jgi:hypothetical protein
MMGKENKPINILSLKYYLYSVFKAALNVSVPFMALSAIAYFYSIEYIDEPIVAVLLVGSLIGLCLTYKFYTSKSANFKGLSIIAFQLLV